MYRLYGTVKSRAMRPLWLLEELGAPYELVEAPPRSEAARAVNPTGKIPALGLPEAEGGAVLTDSVAIMHFLADRHGGFAHPPGTPARARQDAVTMATLELLDAPLWAYAQHSFALPEARRVGAVKDTLRWQIGLGMATLGEMLEGEFAVGETPTLADILLAHCCGWAAGLKMSPEGPLRAHMTRMRARPAFRRALAAGTAPAASAAPADHAE
jgi:glutathione S-transferase